MSQPATLGQLTQRLRDENVLSSVLLELTYSCNLDCTFCYNDLKLQGRRLSLDDYRRLIDDLAGMGVMTLTLSGGEPLMYPHFFEVGAHARKRGFMVNVKSNGVPLNEVNAQRLKSEVDPFKIETSLHGARSATHDRQTRVPGSFERLLRNIEIVKSQGLRVHANAALTRWNETEVEEMFELADKLGIGLRFDPDITPRDDGDRSPLEIAPSRAGVEHMVRVSAERMRTAARKDTIPIQLKPNESPVTRTGQILKICGAGSTNLAIDPFGNVYPCVQFRRKVGNVHDQSISVMWNQAGELSGIRETAAAAYDIAQGHGIGQYCMGSAELRAGNAMEPPEQALQTARIYQRLNREILAEKTPA
jgi:radical SAM protein with 4Fe4S-binding SPASM domain